jgi:PucR-like helix-turn-helix protein
VCAIIASSRQGVIRPEQSRPLTKHNALASTSENGWCRAEFRPPAQCDLHGQTHLWLQRVGGRVHLALRLQRNRPHEAYGSPRPLVFQRRGVNRILTATLGPVLELPAERREPLLGTVHTWLRHGQSVSATAEELHCHRNTINYRLRRFAELTGKPLADNLWLAQVALALEAART